MQKSNTWQWGMIFLSIFVIAGVLIAASFILRASEPEATDASSNSETINTPPSEETPKEEEDTKPSESYKVEVGATVPISLLLESLEVKDEEKSSSYDREEFRHWVNVEGKCSAREFVLLTESIIEVSYTDKAECKVSTGKWLSLYDDQTLSNASDVDIDHMVPLKEAWESGAHSWNDAKRRSYANDVDYDKSLIAVSAKSNRAKSDRDPSDWLPPSNAYICTYLADWVAVKYRWELTIDATEKATIAKESEDCTNLVSVPSKG